MAEQIVATEPEVLTFELISKASGEQMQKWMKTRRTELDAVLLAETKRVEDRLNTDNETYLKEQEEKAAAEAQREVEALEAAKSPEEKAAEEAAAAEAAKVVEEAAAVEAAAKAEAERKDLEEKAKLAEEAAKPKEKIVLDFQATDDDGQPLGRRTHLEADTYEEMQEKMKESYINAVRYAERMKKRAALKPQFKQEEAPIVTLDEAQLVEIQKDLDSKDEIVAAKAKIKLELNEAAKERAQARYQADVNRGASIGLEFRKKHPEYNNCDANAQIIKQYFEAEKLEWTLDNLEYVYGQVESQLAPRQSEAPAAPAAPVEEIKQEVAAANPPAAPASVVAPVQAHVAAPAASTPVETVVPAATNTPAVTTKPPASGIEPGSLHGGRPEVGVKKPVGYTKKQILDMPREEYKKKMKDPGFVRQVNILFKA